MIIRVKKYGAFIQLALAIGVVVLYRLGLSMYLIAPVYVVFSIFFFWSSYQEMIALRKFISRQRGEVAYDLQGGNHTFTKGVLVYLLLGAILLLQGVLTQDENVFWWVFVTLGLFSILIALLLAVTFDRHQYVRLILEEDRLLYASFSSGIREVYFSKQPNVKFKPEKIIIREPGQLKLTVDERDFDPVTFTEFKLQLQEKINRTH